MTHALLRRLPGRSLIVALLLASSLSLGACAADRGSAPLGCGSSPVP